MIELSGITKSFEGHVALHDVNLFVQEGEIFGIIGKSGAGKSTLLRCINLLERPEEGHIVVDGEQLLAMSPKALRFARHKTGMIFQHFNLVNALTVYDNIALPMRIQCIDEAVIRQKVNELAPLVELHHKLRAYPLQLSGGQKQRVAIARALSCSPKILLCDEATSALDPETTDSILALLKKINALYGLTIVIITHEMGVVKRICHRVSIMDAGRIVETAALSTVFSRKKSLVRDLLHTQLSPQLPPCLSDCLTDVPNHKPLIRLFFEGEGSTMPFISQLSRELHLDINILLANIDRVDSVTCGVLVVELDANKTVLKSFIQHCKHLKLDVEVLGYVTDHGL